MSRNNTQIKTAGEIECQWNVEHQQLVEQTEREHRVSQRNSECAKRGNCVKSKHLNTQIMNTLQQFTKNQIMFSLPYLWVVEWNEIIEINRTKQSNCSIYAQRVLTNEKRDFLISRSWSAVAGWQNIKSLLCQLRCKVSTATFKCIAFQYCLL